MIMRERVTVRSRKRMNSRTLRSVALDTDDLILTPLKKLSIKPLTPPLSTAPANSSSMLRKSPSINLQLMSEGPDPDVEILQEIETQMAKMDAIKPSHLSGEVNSDEFDISVID